MKDHRQPVQLMLFDFFAPAAAKVRAVMQAVQAAGAMLGHGGPASAHGAPHRRVVRGPARARGLALSAANDLQSLIPPPGAPSVPEGNTTQPRAPRPRTVKQSKQAGYDVMVRAMLAEYKVTVRKWRTSMSGVAYELRYRDGSVKRMLESPRPKSPLSAAIFLHEVGHHAIGLGVYKPRCLEEYHAWMYSLAQMRAWNIEVTEKVERRVRRSLEYAAGKATRRGIKNLPSELVAYTR